MSDLGFNVDQLRSALFTAPHGGVACDALRDLHKAARSGATQALDVLAEYSQSGRIDHMRTHATSLLAEAIALGDVRFSRIFEKLLKDEATRYWAINGLIRAVGRTSYPTVVHLAFDKRLPLSDRANAIKQLALTSGQVFDRQLPSDPGFWKETDLRLSEVTDWMAAGFQQGPGHPSPRRHPALDAPRTDWERLISRFDSRLTNWRKDEDPANPHNRLTPADPAAMIRIASLWKLPGNYHDFLARFSPLRVSIPGERFYNGGLVLYGAAELMERQTGYAWDQNHRALECWPSNCVVIADHGADPFVLDLLQSTGDDAPVLTAEHGAGRWDFVTVAPGFRGFLEGLVSAEEASRTDGHGPD